MRVIDVGCGPGIYVTALRNMGITADGVDIDESCPFDVVDVFSDAFLERYKGYDICLCLEVAEHLPERLADEFVRRLTGCAPTVVFSAAVPGQGGYGHINCQPKEYWNYKFAEQNYVYDPAATEKFVAFMAAGYHMGWLTNNAQIFKRYGTVYFDQIVQEETPQAQRIAQYFSENNGV